MIDYEDLKKKNPELYKLIKRGGALRQLIPGIDLLTEKFPIPSGQKDMFQDAIAGMIFESCIDLMGEKIPHLKKLSSRKRK